jgi:transposase
LVYIRFEVPKNRTKPQEPAPKKQDVARFFLMDRKFRYAHDFGVFMRTFIRSFVGIDGHSPPEPMSGASYRTLRRVFTRQHADQSRLTDRQWEALRDLFPSQRRGGRWRDHRQVANGVLLVARGHASCWRDLPACCGPWPTIYWRYRRYEKDGTLAQMLARVSDAEPTGQGL